MVSEPPEEKAYIPWDGISFQRAYELTVPTRCRNDHELGPWKMTVSFLPCSCAGVWPNSSGHYQYRCNTCGDQQAPECVDPSKAGRDYRPG